jgi:hypothetical protein
VVFRRCHAGPSGGKSNLLSNVALRSTCAAWCARSDPGQGQPDLQTAKLGIVQAYPTPIKCGQFIYDRESEARALLAAVPTLTHLEDDLPSLRRKAWTIILDEDLGQPRGRRSVSARADESAANRGIFTTPSAPGPRSIHG